MSGSLQPTKLLEPVVPENLGFISKGIKIHSEYCEVVGNIYEHTDLLK